MRHADLKRVHVDQPGMSNKATWGLGLLCQLTLRFSWTEKLILFFVQYSGLKAADGGTMR